jgi:hypothetical protein
MKPNTPKILCLTIIVMLFFCSLGGCNSPNDSTQEFQAVSLDKNAIEIGHNGYLLSNRFHFTKMIGKDSLLYYEVQSSVFYLFNLQTQNLSRLLKFEREGPNFMESIVLDFEKLPNGYVILSQNYLHFINKEGSIWKRTETNQFNSDFETAEYRLNKIRKLTSDNLLVSKWIRSALFTNTKDDPKTSIFAKLDLKTDLVTDLPIYSPSETLVTDPTQGFYNGMSEHYFLTQDNTIIFNFRFSPSIYKYDLMDQSTVQYNAKSEHFPNKREPIPAFRMKDNLYVSQNFLQGVTFSNLEFDEKSGFFIRLASDITADDSGNLGVKKYIQIYDSNFNIISETALDEVVFDKIHVSNGAIYLYSTLQEEESTRILKYKISD